MTQNKKIAVTGGIGSGKSTFCFILKQMGVPVFSCDEIYAELLHSTDYLVALREKFPDCFDGETLVKSRLAERIFSDANAKKMLDSLAHPRIMKELLTRMEGHALSVAEVPLLFEGGFEGLFDFVIVVQREIEERISSIAVRDGLKREEILDRINSQCGEEVYAQKSCIIVKNDGSLIGLRKKAEELLSTIGA